MRKMKRLLALGLAGMMVLSATGCGSSDKTKESAADTTGGSHRRHICRRHNRGSSFLRWRRCDTEVYLVGRTDET